MKICIHDKNLPKDIVEKLKFLGFFLMPTVELKRLNSPLSTHADIQVCKIKENLIVVEPTVHKYYEKNLTSYGIIVKSGIKILESKYPKDCSYNLASNGKIAIHNFDITDEVILKEIDFEKINVNQGYGKCNILFTKNGVITSDMGIYKAIKNYRKLLISPGDIELSGYDYGFIGGASGFCDKVYFIGDIKRHRDFKKIEEFLKEENTEFENLGSTNLMDYGSLIFLNI